MDEEIEYYKRELLLQLDQREKDLNELMLLKKDHESLQKRYYAISNSRLGRITFHYWRLRRKILNSRKRV